VKPIHFPEANSTLPGGPAARYVTAFDVGDLPVHRSGGKVISCWKAVHFRERLRILFTGRVWLWVATPTTHAPVYVGGDFPFERQARGSGSLNEIPTEE
jgi:hypothetical protein